ncbi:hypothetical protein UFOVP377_27 [uncultured Caudovirales phage]|uniref:Uncharacterized protein n=1 Tax=uncultured Caudovirales phage TaxID=2100421 RepID=A0A6J7X5Y2_9CAUD|nr:hypothetical protein UFOVP377_27 [uncultured Caudovirales phage]
MTDLDDLNRLRQQVESALEYSGGTHTFDDIAKAVTENRFQVWPGVNSVVVTEIIVYPRIKNLHYFLAGGDLDELKLMRPYIERWGKSLGCTRVTLAGRQGWAKTFLRDEGYEPKWFILSKEL